MTTSFASSLVSEAMMPFVIMSGMLLGLFILMGTITMLHSVCHRGQSPSIEKMREKELIKTLIAVGILGILIIGCQYSRLIAEWAMN